MDLQKLLSRTRKAIEEFQMIEEGDRIAIGISGGKDSLALLYTLANLRRFYPKKFDIEAITVHLGIDGMDFSPVQNLCDELNVHYTIVPSDIKQIVFDLRKEENPCSLCAKLRKGALNEVALQLGCNKIAYAHHRDDLIETFMMSMIFEGRLHSFSPITNWDRTGLILMRPLIYISESDIIGFQRKYNLPVVKNLCPADGYTKREEMKDLVRELQQKYPGFKEHVYTAILKGKLPGWPERIDPHELYQNKK